MYSWVPIALASLVVLGSGAHAGGIYTQLPDGLDEVDVIIAGGGTAACVVASRLADADPSMSILMIEGGQNNRDNQNIIHPLLFPGAIAPGSPITLFYKAKAEPQLANRELVVPSGGVLGGGSSINFMMYSRAQRHDWDSWNTSGWSANEMIPFIKKLETYYGPGTSATHGKKGPVQVSNGTYTSKRAQDQFITAAGQVGYPKLKDLQNLDNDNGVERALRYVGPDGRRQDAAHRYLHPRLEDGAHPNLHVLVEHNVQRVLFNGTKAVGLEFAPNPAFQNGTEVRAVTARKQVIASCGALGTPLLLERSGLGDQAVLAKANVSTVAHIPGVGSEYMDHHLMTYSYYTSLGVDETYDAVFDGRKNVTELIESNAPILGWNGQDVESKIRPSPSDLLALGPEFTSAYAKDYLDIPNKPLNLMALLAGFAGDDSAFGRAQYLSTSVFTVYPYTRGHIHITSSELGSPLDFETSFLKSPLDVKKLIWSYKKQREIMRRMNVYRGEVPAMHPSFPPGSAATAQKRDKPNSGKVKDIVYTAEDDAAIEDFLRKNVGTTWHSMGTCKMAPLNKGGVVKPNLDVYGVQNLKLVDLSIAPENVGANTGNTAFAVGEKGANIIMKELKIGNPCY